MKKIIRWEFCCFGKQKLNCETPARLRCVIQIISCYPGRVICAKNLLSRCAHRAAHVLVYIGGFLHARSHVHIVVKEALA